LPRAATVTLAMFVRGPLPPESMLSNGAVTPLLSIPVPGDADSSVSADDGGAATRVADAIAADQDGATRPSPPPTPPPARGCAGCSMDAGDASATSAIAALAAIAFAKLRRRRRRPEERGS
jgi:MYXO-CTERM domain-containing protein